MIQAFLNSPVIPILEYIYGLAPFWAPLLLALLSWKLWIHYVNINFLSSMKWILLEVRIPKDVYKSPLAMEIALGNALYQTGGTGTWFAKYWEGKLRNWFSLEIVSIEGNVFFFIRTPAQFKNIIEAQIYAQYPKAEVSEVDDYVNNVPIHKNPKEWSIFGTEFVLTKADPYPIKTYVDYGLDKSMGLLEDNQQIDPITSTMEFLGSLGAGEQIWIQILVRGADDKRFPKPGEWFGGQGWKDVAKEEIKTLKAKHKGEKDKPGEPMTKGDQEVISAIEKSMSKLGFDCGIRAVYVARKDSFKGTHIAALTGIFRQYGSTLNGFKPTNVTGFDYPWQDFSGVRSQKIKAEIFDAYCKRSYFYPPHASQYVAGVSVERKPFVLTTEELATIYHFPGRVSETPSFKRIESKKSEPPVNLPV